MRRPRVAAPGDRDRAAGLDGTADPRTLRRGQAGRLASAGRPPRLRLHTEQQHDHQAALFAGSGYQVVRYYNEMHRPLDIGFPEVELDDELELVAFGPQLHEAVRLAHNEVFKGNWGSEPRDEEGWGFVVTTPRRGRT